MVNFHTPIHSKGNTDDPNNYRGFSLLPEISKYFTSIINTRLKIWRNSHNIIGQEQAGFHAQFSTTNNAYGLHTLITKYLR